MVRLAEGVGSRNDDVRRPANLLLGPRFPIKTSARIYRRRSRPLSLAEDTVSNVGRLARRT